MENAVLYSETQRFQWWLVALVALVCILIIGVCLLFVFSRLETRITSSGISARYYPMHREWKTFRWEDLSNIYVRQYAPVAEYGGWGFKGHKGDRAWNVSGKNGLQLVFRDGNKLLIGTQKPEEVQAVLENISKSGTYIPRE